ncbi:MAG: DNA-binding protein WhiA [Candidatus Eremiobacteraeota bacterium]|nr:DNA-binding protein WhiA [Candidatus Eremiobacteraeota bacterium]MBV9648425.1 DNA-binding protein WhiA [Candidatus Eremiobacteraeota bacterium]
MAHDRSTLSGDTKDALAREIPAAEHCRAALRNGLALYGIPHGRNAFRTQRPAIARLFWSLLPDESRQPIRKITSARLRKAPVYEIAAQHIEAKVHRPSVRCDRRMEVRAAFLACGSIAEPARGYHLEFVPPSLETLVRLRALLRADGHEPRASRRKGRELLYFKELDAIVGVLSAIGAYAAVLRLEDVRALKETKNRIHRLVNTEAANVDRAVTAAAAQRETIALLADAYGLQNLSPVLREVAELRMRHPTETLADLGRRCHPPVGKSTVNGRLSALLRVARRAVGGTSTEAAADRSR